MGIGLLTAAMAWTVVAAVAAGGNPFPVLAVMALAAGALGAGRTLRSRERPLMPAVVIGAAAVLALASVGSLFSGQGAAGPFSYANAKGAFFWQAALAGLMVALTWGGTAARVVGGAAAVVFAAVAASSGEMSLLVVLAMGPLALLALLGRRAARPVVTLAAVGFAGVLSLSLWGATDPDAVRGSDLGREVAARLDDRLPLWREARSILAEHRLTGVGPLRFQEVSPTAARDRDLRWAHHGFLQQGAEGGAPAMMLLVLGFAWGFARLWAAPEPSAAGVAAVALASLGAHASVDYVLHFPVIAVAAGSLVGAGQRASELREERAPGPVLRRSAKAAFLPLGLLAPRSPNDLVILVYHRIGAGHREVDIAREAFEAQVAALAEEGRPRRIDDVTAGDGSGGIVLSVDDGYRDFHEHALPVLVRHGVPAVLYLATGLVAGEEHAPDGDALTWEQLGEAVSTGLVTVGSHTHGHVDVSRVPKEVVREEMLRSKELIEDRLGVPCRHFAYPWGVSSAVSDGVARELFDTAALGWQTNRPGRTDTHRLGRTPVLRSDGRLFFRAKLRGLLDGEALAYRLARRGPWRPVS